ncbi:MAG: HYR domain-containing protein [Saprospiraceae bacterium]|nr:HYR domain-containing protein [Saprospiraceae bacterium]
MKWKYSFYSVFFVIYSLLASNKGVSQIPNGTCDCPYPIIFVHGWGGDGATWYNFSDQLKSIWGDNISSGGIFEANLNVIEDYTKVRGQNNEFETVNYVDDDVKLHYQNPFNITLQDKCIYAINFNVQNYSDDSDSNQSSPYKQGYALGKMIKKVIQVTGKEKVILVGHSMGGICIREYLQRKESEEHIWWAFPNEQNTGHRVARVLTVGTPHLGSNLGQGIDNINVGLDLHSEAVRDLRTYYTKGIPPLYIDYLKNPYLFSGFETNIELFDGGIFSFYNYDVNCDGTENNFIDGINNSLNTLLNDIYPGFAFEWFPPNSSYRFPGTQDNQTIPLPNDIKYTYYVGNTNHIPLLACNVTYGSGGDGVVDDQNQWLYVGGNGNTCDFLDGNSKPRPFLERDYFLADRLTSENLVIHSQKSPKEIDDYNFVVKGIDEPDFPYFAYEIEPTKWYAGVPQIRADIVAENSNVIMYSGGITTNDRKVDGDWYYFELDKNYDNLKIQLKPSTGIEARVDFFNSTEVDLFSNDYSNISSNIKNSEGIIEINTCALNSGKYYIRISHNLHSTTQALTAWKNPYKFHVLPQEQSFVSYEVDCSIGNETAYTTFKYKAVTGHSYSATLSYVSDPTQQLLFENMAEGHEVTFSFPIELMIDDDVLLTVTDLLTQCSTNDIFKISDCDNYVGDCTVNDLHYVENSLDCEDGTFEIFFSGQSGHEFNIYLNNEFVTSTVSNLKTKLDFAYITQPSVVVSVKEFKDNIEVCSESINVDISICTNVGNTGNSCGIDGNGIYHLFWPFNAGNNTGDFGTTNTHGVYCHQGSDYYSLDYIKTGGICNEFFYSPLTGTVIDVYNSCAVSEDCTSNGGCGIGNHPFGNQIVIKSYYTNHAFRIAHLNDIFVNEGDAVFPGTLLGQIGNSGNSYGAHAHVTMYKNLDQITSNGNTLLYCLENSIIPPDVDCDDPIDPPNEFAQEFNFDCNAYDVEINSFSSQGQCMTPGTSFDLSFTEVSTATRYFIEYCNADDITDCKFIDEVSMENTSLLKNSFIYTWNNIPNEPGEYFLKIYDPDNTVNKALSSFSFSIDENCNNQFCGDVPQIDIATLPTETDIILNLTPINGMSHYRFQVKYTNSENWLNPINYFNNTMEWLDASPCTGYDFRVAAVCEDGTFSDWSDVLTVVTLGCTDGTGGGSNDTSASLGGDCPGNNDDDEDPVFLNCPTNPYEFSTDPDNCSAYVNWSIPVAVDNCAVTVSHVSGPQQGSEVPQGTYTVTYVAEDMNGNSAFCSFNIIVHDTQLPYINCPQDVWVDTDPGVCEAAVDNIAPEFAFDNCNLSVSWAANGAAPSSGSDDASGTVFPIGTTTLTYTISELSNPDGNRSASCEVLITVIDTENPIITCPADVLIGTSLGGVGDCQTEFTWNHPDPSDNCGVSIYTITFNYPDGSSEGPIDILGSAGAATSHIFGLGTTSIMYHAEDEAGNFVDCTWTVAVIDDEPPVIYCDQVFATNTYQLEDPLTIKPLDTSIAVINVIPSMTITDFNVLNLEGTHHSMGALKITLTSPAGTEIVLFDGLCPGTEDFDIAFDDEVSDNVSLAPCSPLGNGGIFIPQEVLSAFNGENSHGLWTFTVINNTAGSCGSIDSIEIEIIGNDIGTEYNRLQVVADPVSCSYIMNGTDFDPPFNDNCSDPYIRHDFIFGPFDNTLQGSEFQLGENFVTWIAYDQAGNSDTCVVIIDVLDIEKPHFINCPTLDYVQDAQPGICGAYITFSQPIAVDNCNEVTVTKTDSTGLISGNVFPVGLSILEFEAKDPSNNISVCSLRIIVNDTQLPHFDCPGDVLENTDPGKCGAKVFQIGPTLISDNCTDNVSVVWQTEWPSGSGEIVNGGVVNASGEMFYKDTSTVTYRLADQPLVLITEVTHAIDTTNGGMHPSPYTVITNDDYLEIANIGPVTMNLSGLQIERISGTESDIFTVPDNTIMPVGKTMVIHFGNGTDDVSNLFFNVPCAQDWGTGVPSAYIMSFKGRVLDLVSLNGFDPVGEGSLAIATAADWKGSMESILNKGGAYRRFSYDNNSSIDWIVAHTCDPVTIGKVNPEIDIIPDNGTTSAFQSIPPHVIECDFEVVVVDQELPYCGEFHEHIYSGATNLGIQNSISGGVIYESVINVPDNFKIGELALRNVKGNHPDMSELHFKLVGPNGQAVNLFKGLCPGQPNFNFNIANDTMPRINTAPCSPLGQGGFYSTENDISAVTFGFYGKMSAGKWTLIICDSLASNSGQLNSWQLVLYEIAPYSQTDTTYANEAGLCGAEFTWVHPRLIDNCKAGTIKLKFVTEDDINVPDTPGEIEPATEMTRFFEVGTTTVRYILTDGSGNVDSCEFNVTILDTEKPVVVCPGDIHVYLDGGECRKVVCYEPLSATDNCEVVDTVYSIQPCTFFEIGDTKVYITIYDPAGNGAICDFDVIIHENIVEHADLACNDEISISLDATCIAEILPDMLFEGNNYRSYEDYVVTLMYLNGDTFDTPPFVTAVNLSDTLRYTVHDGDHNNECMGIIIVLKKIEPEIQCPKDTTIQCNIDPLRYENGQLATGYLSLLSCELDYEINFEDKYKENPDCSNPIAEIVRKFTLIDEDGQKVSCNQKINIAPFTLDQLVFPKDIKLECKPVDENPNLLLPQNTGYPKYQNGELITNWEELCDLSYSYEDMKLQICEGSYEILRTWVVRNRCAPVSNQNPVRYTQLIEVLDKKAPEIIHCPENMIIGAQAYTCEGEVFLPIPTIHDNCSSVVFDAEIYGNGFIAISGNIYDGSLKIYATKLDKDANTIVRYFYEDACGNETSCEFNIKVIDNSGPIPACEQYKTVSMTSIGTAMIDASDFDSGSFDNCNPVWFKVLRVNDQLEYDGGCPELNGDDKPKTATIDVWYDDNVFFCCEDIGSDVMVNLRVFDKDPGEGPVDPSRMAIGGDLYGHYNDCWNITHIECKVPPALTCMPVTITCEESLDPNENPRLWPEVVSVCGVELEFKDSRDNSVCEANITRIWTAKGCNKSSTCKQTIKIIGTTPFDPCTIVFPGDKQVHCTNELTDGGKPTWDENPCNIVTAEIIREDTFTFVEDACYKILREWAVIDWCRYEKNTGAESNIDAVQGRKLNCNNLVKDGYYRYTQVLKVVDLIPPKIEAEDNYVATSGCFAYNVEMKATASDSCNTNEEYWWKYKVEDLNCVCDPVQVSYNWEPKPTGVAIGKRSLDNLDKVTEAKLLILDPLAPGHYKVTWIVGDGCGNATSKEQYFTVADNKAPTPVMEDMYTVVMENDIVELKARWFDKGGCGEGCNSSFDNCTENSDLYFTYTPMIPNLWVEPVKWANQFEQYGRYFFDPNNGAISTEDKFLTGSAHAWYPESRSSSRVFLCTYIKEIYNYSTVQIYVWDQFALDNSYDYNNYDFVNLFVNFNNCRSSVLSGQTKFGQEGFKGITVTCSNDEESFTKITEQDGKYEFDVYPGDYKIKSSSDNNYLAGISTLDILLIQKYILGLKQINDPLLLLAADVNMNDKITATDILELRKTLLGITGKFTNNSWIGVYSDYVFNNPEKANEESLAAREIKVAIDRNQRLDNLDFKVVKIGDLNKSYQHIEGRSGMSLKFITEDMKLEKGRLIEIPVYAENFTEISGFQYTMELGQVALREIKGGVLEVSSSNYNVNRDALLFSWNGAESKTVEDGKVLFTMVVEPKEGGMLSDNLKINDRILRSESYRGIDLEILNVKLDYRTHEFILYQNEPNPYSKETMIGFELPKEEEYILRIYDVNGQEIYLTRSKGKAGYNAVTIGKEVINTSGIYYYRLESGENAATRKMIYYK